MITFGKFIGLVVESEPKQSKPVKDEAKEDAPKKSAKTKK